MSQGRKDDSEKLRFSLLPWREVVDVIRVLEFGAGKYGVENCKSLADARTRYFNALHRHLEAWWSGERYAEDSKLPHLAHVACNALFLAWFDYLGDKQSQ